MEPKVDGEKAKRLWSHLFGEEDKAELKNLTQGEYDRLVGVLGNLEISIDWEADRAGRSILLWKPKSKELLSQEYFSLILLIALSTGIGRKKWLGSGRKNKNSC